MQIGSPIFLTSFEPLYGKLFVRYAPQAPLLCYEKIVGVDLVLVDGFAEV